MIRPRPTSTSSLSAAIGLATCALATPASAQDGRGDWAFDLGAATDNRSKDASKSDGKPYAYGSAAWESEDGLFYAGAGAETINSSGSRLETEAFFGVQPQVAGFDLDLSVARKWRVDSDPGADDQAWEFTANLSRDIGPARARLQLQASPDGAGAAERWTWIEARLGWTFTDRLDATVALGRREQDDAPDYTGWNAGLTWAVTRRLDADLRWYDTDAKVPGRQYAGALVAGVTVAF